MTDEPWYQTKPIDPKKLFEKTEGTDLLQNSSELANALKKLKIVSKPEKHDQKKNDSLPDAQ